MTVNVQRKSRFVLPRNHGIHNLACVRVDSALPENSLLLWFPASGTSSHPLKHSISNVDIKSER